MNLTRRISINPHSAFRIPHSDNSHSPFPIPHSVRGQALLELAVLGSFALLVLGALVNYGLNADFTQQAAMRSFRQALMSASEAPLGGKPSSVSYVHIGERHVPSPSSPFGIGSILPIPAEGRSVTRNPHTQEVVTGPGTIEELPRMAVEIKGSTCPGSALSPAGSPPPCFYATSGFRVENNVPQTGDTLDRYHEIYGRSNVCAKTACGGVCVTMVKKACVVASTLRMIDRCEGEIINYGDCIRQSRMIVDPQVCAAQCEKAKLPGSSTNCQAVCNAPMNVPWYAQDGTEAPGTHANGTHLWTFPHLDTLFAGIKALGPQPGYDKATTMNTNLAREEQKLTTQTTSHVIWRDDTTRRVIHAVKPLDYVQNPGTPLIVTPTTEPDDSVKTTPKNEDSTTTWETPQ